MIVPKGKKIIYGKHVFKEGEMLPPHIVTASLTVTTSKPEKKDDPKPGRKKKEWYE